MGREEGGHTPVLTKNSDGSVTVKVNHVMVADGEKDDHWIEYVYARDSAGTIVAIQKFVPTDENPAMLSHPQKVQAQLHLSVTATSMGCGKVHPYEEDYILPL